MGTKTNPGPFDCYGKAADDEPIFTLRAKDPNAPDVICYWVQQRLLSCFREGRSILLEADKLHHALQIARDMEEWRRLNVKSE